VILLETSDEIINERLNGYIIKFDMGRNRGVISGKGGVKYEFSSSNFIEKIDGLNATPGVSFDLENGEAVRIANDGTLPKVGQTPNSGLAILGAAKCPECKWRLPILPNQFVPQFRRQNHGRCPNCNTSIKLLSAFKGYHHVLAVGIFVVPATVRFFLGKLGGVMDEQTFQAISIISVLFYPVQILLFFYLYFQEKFVKLKTIDVFE